MTVRSNIAPSDLTSEERRALQALSRITAGETTFLNVVDGDALVRKGLAELFGKGQFILTDEGYHVLERLERGNRTGG